MNNGGARYDGHAEWYDQNFGVYGEDQEVLRSLVGTGSGLCVDLACGAGRYAATIIEAGYRVIGVDVSSDQLRIDRQRIDDVILADGMALPFADNVIELVVGTYFHTDVEDLGGIMAQVHRILQAGGSFVYIGLHPAFIGPFVDRSDEHADKTLNFQPGYRRVGNSACSKGGCCARL
jgi:ubiquinone/menaquinone biosynthesis C-methylase UbiE